MSSAKGSSSRSSRQTANVNSLLDGYDQGVGTVESFFTITCDPLGEEKASGLSDRSTRIAYLPALTTKI